MRRRRFLVLPALVAVAAMTWSGLGTFSSASGQQKDAKDVIRRAHEGAAFPKFKEPVFLLVLGGDARERFGNPSRTRMDSIHILALDPAGLRATIVGIPRDSFVQIPGHGTNKINAAGFFGGAPLMVRTVEGLSGCRFDYYMLTSFRGFQNAVDAFGGIRFRVPKPGLFDRFARAALKPGVQTLDGKESLAWSRSRKQRPRGDFDRSLAQGQLMVAALAEARRDYGKNATTTMRNILALRTHLHLDIPLFESLRLGLLALRISPKRVRNIVVSGSIGSHPRAGSIVRITAAGKAQLRDVCNDGILGS